MSTYISAKVARWYVVYTKSRTEKKVVERLLKKDIEAYVPIRKQQKQWSDRKKWVEEPIIRSYVFVKIILSQYFEILYTPGVVRYLFFLGKPASIPDKQIKMLKKITQNQINYEITTEKLKPGERVEIIEGALKGSYGELISIKGKRKVVLKIDHISELFIVEIAPESLEVVT